MIELVKSRVIFDEEAHTYEINGNGYSQMLSGITPIVDWVYRPYEGVNKTFLTNAARRGTGIHQLCQMADEGFPNNTYEVQEYLRIKDEYDLHTLESEWLVDDGSRIASAIDKVFEDGSIADIKTTAALHMDCVTLQLSIYAYLLELMNEGFKVPNLYVIWLPQPRYGKPKLVQVKRISCETCEKVIDMYFACGDAEQAKQMILADVFKEYAELERELAETEIQLKELERREKELKEKLMLEMINRKDDKYTGVYLKASIVPASVKTTFDSKALKEAMPDVWAKYKRETATSQSIRITINK